MQRFRITTTPPDAEEQTWVLLPDIESATMQAQELSQREKGTRVRVYREETGAQPVLEHDLLRPARA